MASATLSLTERPAWKALQGHYEKIRATHLRTLFAEDSPRGGASARPFNSRTPIGTRACATMPLLGSTPVTKLASPTRWAA